MNAVRNYQKELDKIIENIGVDGKSVPTLLLHSCCAPCSSYVLEYLREHFRITVFYYNPNISMKEEYRKRVAEQKRLIAAYNEAISKEYATSISLLNEKRQISQAENGGLQDVKTGYADVQVQSGNLWDVQMKSGNVQMGQAQSKSLPNMSDPEGNNRCYPISVIEGDYEPERFYEIARGLEQCPEGGERCFNCYELRLRETVKRAQAEGYDYFATTLTISPLKNAVKLNEIGGRLAAEYGISWLPSDFKKKGGYQRSIELSKEYDLYRQDYCGCVYSKEEREKEV